MSKFANELQAKALKFILLNQFVKIDVEQLENYAHMITKYKIIEPNSPEKKEGGEERERRENAICGNK